MKIEITTPVYMNRASKTYTFGELKETLPPVEPRENVRVGYNDIYESIDITDTLLLQADDLFIYYYTRRNEGLNTHYTTHLAERSIEQVEGDHNIRITQLYRRTS